MAAVTLKGVRKVYSNGHVAVEGADVAIGDGELMVLVGPSGCGKSTLLRMVAGLEEVTAGSILIGNRDVTQLEPRDRDIAMVFQSYALYPHMTVEENLGFGLKLRNKPTEEIAKLVKEAAQVLDLTSMMERLPKQLSGGQRQRVALARALANKPEIIVADEPTGNLDVASTQQVFGILRGIADNGQTVVVVTHDAALAARADRRIHIVDGKIAETTFRGGEQRQRQGR